MVQRIFIYLVGISILISCSDENKTILCGAEHLSIYKNECSYVTGDGSLLNSICNRDSIIVKSGSYSCFFNQENQKSFGKKLKADEGYSKVIVQGWTMSVEDQVSIVMESKSGYQNKSNIQDYKMDKWNLLSDTIVLKKDMYPVSIFFKNNKGLNAYVDDVSFEFIR